MQIIITTWGAIAILQVYTFTCPALCEWKGFLDSAWSTDCFTVSWMVLCWATLVSREVITSTMECLFKPLAAPKALLSSPGWVTFWWARPWALQMPAAERRFMHVCPAKHWDKKLLICPFTELFWCMANKCLSGHVCQKDKSEFPKYMVDWNWWRQVLFLTIHCMYRKDKHIFRSNIA